MPSKASMLMLIARSVAAATGRFARVAEQAAGLDRLPQPSSAAMAAIPPAMDAAPKHRVVDGWIGPGIPAKDFVGKSKMKFVAQEKDLESDEALWALYERWCEAFNQKRDHDEMRRRFKKFKETVWLVVHRANKASLPYKLALDKFADGKLMELCANRDNREAMLARKAGKSWVLLKPGDRFLRRVFSDFKVVNGKLFVIYPSKASRGCFDLEELDVEYEVFAGQLFVNLPEEHELVVPNEDRL